MDTPLRAAVSQAVNNRLIEDIASLSEKTPACDIIDVLMRRIKKDGRTFRGLDPVGKDRKIILLVSDPGFMISGFILRTVTIYDFINQLSHCCSGNG
jgi:hypothetical protein